MLRAALCDLATPALPRRDDHHDLVNAGVEHMLNEQSAVGGQLGRPTGARFRTYALLTRYAQSLEGRMLPYDAPNLDALKLVIQDIHDHPLRQGATDRLNRLLRGGAGEAEIARAAIEMRDNDVLSVVQEDAQSREPKIVCSMGLVG